MNDHDSHCFIATPFGKDEEEKSRIRGWVDEVILPVVAELNLVAEVALLSNAPISIGLEIRTHLAFDRLAIVDLGGATGDDVPNPNVMYELGIRHAFDLPTVVLAWDTQVLPFDIGEHRVIRARRHAGTFKWHRDTLKEFGEAALRGDFFRPMNQVRHSNLLDNAAALSSDATLRAIVSELKDVRHSLASLQNRIGTPSITNSNVSTVPNPNPTLSNIGRNI